MIKFDIRDLSFSYGEIPLLKNLNIDINENTINTVVDLLNKAFNYMWSFVIDEQHNKASP